MSTLNRSNKPGRLPSSDIENPYFRAWALRGSESSSSTSKVGAAYSNPPSPKTCPPAFLTSQTRPRRTERSGQQSETSIANLPPTQSPLHATDIVHSHIYQTVQEEGSQDLKDRTSSQVSKNSPDRNSKRSSVISTVQRLFSSSHNRDKTSTSDDHRSSRESRKSLQWKRETSGHIFEFRIGKKRSSTEMPDGLASLSELDSIAQRGSTNTSRAYASAGNAENSTLTPEVALLDRDQGVSCVGTNISEIYAKTPTSLSTPKSTLYNRAKKVFNSRRNSVSRQEPFLARTVTGEILEKASNALRQVIDKHPNFRGPDTSSSSTSGSTLSIAAQRWKRLRLGIPNSNHSSTSSMQSTLGAKPPASTPNAGSLYTGSDQKQYLVVDISSPHGPAFLPSEAQRIATPPLTDPFEGNRKLRGFFFDYNTPFDTEAPSEPTTPGYKIRRRPMLGKKRSEMDWYRVTLDAIDAEEELGQEELSREEFVLNIPEHLPSSPMCPRHPKHKSGGKGVCVYHGRSTSPLSTPVYDDYAAKPIEF